MNDVLLFVNPIAGGGKARTIADRLMRAVKKSGSHVYLFDRVAHSIPNRDIPKNAGAMIVVGGDGTLRAAIQRMLSFGNIPPVLTIPFGTANLMARHLKLEWNEKILPEQVVAALRANKVTSLDVAKANEQLFLLMAGVGIDAAVVHELDRLRTGPINYASYALPALEAMRSYDYPSLRVTIDGKCVLKNEPAMAFVGNVREYGTGFPILTKAQSDDDVLDVCVLPCPSRRRVVRLLMAVASGDHLHEEGVIYAQGRQVQIESAQPVPVQLDGDAAGHTPVNIQLLPLKLPFIVQ
ncbi:MAG TPA: diacylglycerol kinase family protein [Tepidisphaeraceae bacterium]|nr:diacylglycerol kinase family protein [Tepidisphaeraceae bacterium]